MTFQDDKQKMKIIVSDINGAGVELFNRLFGANYGICEANTGEEISALARKLGSSTALIILSLNVPGCCEVIAEIKEDPATKDIPVAVIAADDDAVQIEKAYGVGASDYINLSSAPGLIKKRTENIIRLSIKNRMMQKLALENQTLAEKTHWLEYNDELTNCLNAEGFRRRAEELLRQHPGQQYALWYSDIKNFKFINEAFGFSSGNRFLKYWSELLKQRTDEDETFGRISADRFAVLSKMGTASEMKATISAVHAAVGSYFKNYRVSVCSGIYVIKPGDLDEMSVDQMLDHARVAQRRIKNSGGDIAFFDEKLWDRQWRNMAISNHLDDAIKDGEISIWLQPQYNYITKRLIGAEALCRWNHALLGPISPGEFIPLLENTGQICRLDYYMWEQSCILMEKWQKEGLSPLTSISVNISRVDLREGNVCERLTDMVKRHGLTNDMLRLEITEGAYMEEAEKLIGQVKKFQSAGFTVEMDDFGSGYSSLNMLKEVPVDILKLDFKFLNGEDNESRSGIILSSVLKMAHQMEIPVICEGVETAEQANFMKNLGCALMQGYYFAKPIPVSEFEKIMHSEEGGKIPEISSGIGLRKINELLDEKSSSAFIFDKCIGGAILVKYYNSQCDAILVNDSFYDIAGVVRNSNIYCVNLLDTVEDGCRENVVAAMDAAVETGTSVCEFQIKLNGRWLFARFKHVSLADRGNVLFVSLENMTENHEMRSMLAELNNELQDHMKLMPCGFFRYEAYGDQNFIYVSDGMLSMLGFSTKEEFLKRYPNFPEMVYKEDRQRILKEIDDQIACGPYDFCEYRIATADGKLKWVYDKGHIVHENTGKSYFYVIIIDMGE